MTATHYDAVLFDLDGTLLDTAPDFIVVVNQLRQRYGHAPIDHQSIRNTVSNGARALVTLAFGLTENDSEFENIRNELLDAYEQELGLSSQLFAGFNELIDWMNAENIHWGIVTNKPRRFTIPLLDKLNLSSNCATVVCPDDVSQTKPHPEPLFLASKQIGCQPQRCIYVGDHHRDIESGRRAGMKTIAAAYGYIESDSNIDEWQADHCVTESSMLQPLLRSIRHN